MRRSISFDITPLIESIHSSEWYISNRPQHRCGALDKHILGIWKLSIRVRFYLWRSLIPKIHWCAEYFSGYDKPTNEVCSLNWFFQLNIRMIGHHPLNRSELHIFISNMIILLTPITTVKKTLFRYILLLGIGTGSRRFMLQLRRIISNKLSSWRSPTRRQLNLIPLVWHIKWQGPLMWWKQPKWFPLYRT